MVQVVQVTAETRRVDEANLDALREELAALEAAEARLSAERRRLHQQIDFGYSTSETLLSREREVSDERRDLHRRIDRLSERLGLTKSESGLPLEKPTAVRELEPDQGPERLPYPAAG